MVGQQGDQITTGTMVQIAPAGETRNAGAVTGLVSQFLITPAVQTCDRLAYATGMRRQRHLLVSQWLDLDWQAQTVRDRRHVYEPKGGGFCFLEPTQNGSGTAFNPAGSLNLQGFTHGL